LTPQITHSGTNLFVRLNEQRKRRIAITNRLGNDLRSLLAQPDSRPELIREILGRVKGGWRGSVLGIRRPWSAW
jgi:hypothetical protein